MNTLRCFVNVCSGDFYAAKELLTRNMKLREANEEVFTKRFLDSPEIARAMKVT